MSRYDVDKAVWDAEQRQGRLSGQHKDEVVARVKAVMKQTASKEFRSGQARQTFTAERRAELFERFKQCPDTGKTGDGAARMPILRDVKIGDLKTYPILFDNRDRQEGQEVRKLFEMRLEATLERDGKFDDLVDVQEFEDELVVLDGHTRLAALVRYYAKVNEEKEAQKTRGRKLERLTVREHFGDLKSALVVSRKENSKERQTHSILERQEIAWRAWVEDEAVSIRAQAAAAGLGLTTVKAMRRVYSPLLTEFPVEFLKQRDWVGIMWLHKNKGEQGTPDEIKAREARMSAYQRQADEDATLALRTLFSDRPLKQKRRTRVAFVGAFGSALLQEIAREDEASLVDEDEGE